MNNLEWISWILAFSWIGGFTYVYTFYFAGRHFFLFNYAHSSVHSQTKRRKLSYSADDLDKSGIDDTKVEQILAKKPGITFNIQEDWFILNY
jgi:hypothetical protein